MHLLTSACRVGLAAMGVVLVAACADQPTAIRADLPNAVESPSAPSLSKAPTSARYKLQFVVTDPESGGEITSDPFPAAGVTLNTNDPWRQMTADGALVTLTSPTHGMRWDGSDPNYKGTCRFAEDVNVNWSIASAPTRSFAGTWLLTVSTTRDRYGINFYVVGPRSVNGVASTSYGVIQNIASNRNVPVESSAPDGSSWFEIEFTNARLGFGSASSPDGAGTLFYLPDYETACANFKLRADKM